MSLFCYILTAEEERVEAAVTSTQTCELVRSSQGSQATTTQSSQSTQAKPTSSIQEKATQSGLPAVAVQQAEGAFMRPPSRDDTFDLKEMHDQMCELARELDERKKEVDKYRRLHQASLQPFCTILIAKGMKTIAMELPIS